MKAQGLPVLETKQQPEFEKKSFCPPMGRLSKNSDPERNKMKNRIDGPWSYERMGFDRLMNLPSPQGILKKKRSDWTPQQRAMVKKNEGIPIVVHGYFLLTYVNGKALGAVPDGPEECNCGKRQEKYRDYRIWLVNNPDDKESAAIIAQMTPRLRAKHGQWTLENLTYIAKGRLPVRVYGWLLFEEDEQKQVGTKRATLWEIHPIIQIEFRDKGEWITL